MNSHSEPFPDVSVGDWGEVRKAGENIYLV